MHSSGFFRIMLIARLILKREISGSHMISDQCDFCPVTYIMYILYSIYIIYVTGPEKTGLIYVYAKFDLNFNLSNVISQLGNIAF